MGNNSSQPVPDPGNGATISRPTDMNSPKMDDIAASQQLIEEEGRAVCADDATDEGGGRSNPPSKQDTRRSVQFSARDDIIPSSPPSAPRANGRSPPAHNVQVPDSQVEASPTPTRAPVSPPMTSSIPTPARSSRKKKTHKKSRSIDAEPGSSAPLLGNDSVDRNNAAQDENVLQTPRSTGPTPKAGLIKALITPSKPQTRGTKSAKRRETCIQTPKTPSTNEPLRRYRCKKMATTSINAADGALNSARELHLPHDLRESGLFTADEEELIRRAIRDYQERYGLATNELVEIIQWTTDVHDCQVARTKADWTPQEIQEEEESDAFWEELKQIGLKRAHKQVKRHVRAHYHTFETGNWTEEEDEQLKSLMELHPRRWKLISLVMGNRSQSDIRKHWEDHVKYGKSRHTNRWSRQEEKLLVHAITTVTQRDENYRAENGEPSQVVSNRKAIDWPQVSIEMGNIRSRAQCIHKWKQMQKRNPPTAIPLEHKARRASDPDETVETTSQKRVAPSEQGGGSAGVTDQKRGRVRKSEAAASPGDSGQTAESRPKKRRRLQQGDKPVGSADAIDESRPAKKRRKSKKSARKVAEHDREQPDVASEEKATDLPSERTPMEQRDEAPIGQEPDQYHQPEVPTTSELQPQPPVSRPRTPGVAQMRWGDKFDLLEAVINREPDHEEDLDWHDVVAAMKRPWSIKTLQAALRELLTLVMDQGTLYDTLIELIQLVHKQHTNAELNEHYDPYQDADLDGDVDLAEEMDMKGSAELVENRDGAAASTLPNTKRERKLDTGDRLSRSRDVSPKRKKAKSEHDPAFRVKSTYLVTESDDTEREGEL
ncbi:hypothetical protein CC86DRAFT_362231 [Ophiobolus disseminans]|uniref:Uncharacterized protein n=1 Tax=Ophiobolus disseminans TaxID=1469910 RepID=A0A6A6ZHZ9_9PLEO|nr:hypothetical protein CC86DRAFT_362231 [Ophiobolus disseminans]